MAIVLDEASSAVLDEFGNDVLDEASPPAPPSNFPPLTIWRPQTTDGTGELTQSTNATIETESGLDITTEAGITLIIEALTYTPKPATVWTQNDSM